MATSIAAVERSSRSISHATGRRAGVLYDEPIGGVGYGSDLGEFTADGDEAFLVANQSLIVLDASDGRIKKRITEFRSSDTGA